MSAKVEAEAPNLVVQTQVNQSASSENLLMVPVELSDSELRWVQLHQMFDK